MFSLPEKEKVIQNFSRCHDWEERYLYIIELGIQLPNLTAQERHPINLINGCQSQVWIVMKLAEDGTVLFTGDSDSAIVKGLIVIVFIFYQNLLPKQIINLDIKSFFADLELSQHLTLGRSQGLEAMVRTIRSRANTLYITTSV